MAMTIPTIPDMPAGHLATVADMNNLGAMATFLLTKPIAHVHDGTGGVAIAGLATASITFTIADFDTDGMWNAGTPTRLTIQTPGYYRVRWMINFATAAIVATGYVNVTTGAGNPLGAGIVTSSWAGYSVGHPSGTQCHAGGAGILPAYMFAGDYAELKAKPSGNATTGTTTMGSWMSLELVSI